MRMANIMNYKLLLYVFNIMLSIYALSGINFNILMKKNKDIESRILVMIFAFIISYLLTNFIYDFLKVSAII